jgi:hypothetical protein
MRWTELVVDRLADGEWHNWADLVFEASRQVPPGRAMRTALGDRIEDARSWDAHRQDRAVSRGQWTTAADAVRGLVRRGRVEQRGDGLSREIRLLR